jgi:type VI secretion system secreted protein Hcp
MTFLRSRKLVPSVLLVVRKAGATPFEYFKIQLTDVRITGLRAESQGNELLEHLRLAFAKVLVTYTPQGATGGSGGGASQFETDASQ